MQPTREITMNAVDLDVHEAGLTFPAGQARAVDRISYDKQAETATLHLGETPIAAGRAQLRMTFSGVLSDQLHGFYLSTYRAPDGTAKRMATTQFEATDARRAFPCWDEPAFKATFQVDLIVPKGYAAVSNTLEESRTQEGADKERVRFKTTPVMSTYLLVFIVSEMESIEARADRGTLVRVWTTPGQAERGREALDVAVRLLKHYNDYFGIPYPLEKLDHIAIPDFAAGAMENWGGITYREVALLFDPASSSPGTRQRIAEIVAHEMAHMWFGDLVTMRWWNDLWLNESFASWMATKAVDYLHPEWEVWTQFIAADVAGGMGLDGLANSHPIESEVRNPAEVSQLFDAISYDKGASIIRMLEQYIGPEVFQRGLHLYMSRHAYANAAGADLWQAMAEASGQDIPSMMDSWIKQVGYPVVTADVRRQDGRIDVNLIQQRFLYSGPNEDKTLWHVPVRIGVRGNPEAATGLFRERSATMRLTPPARYDGWVKVNSDTTSFFRVRYGKDELGRLIEGVRRGELSAPDRLGLLEDTYALARARFLPVTDYLELAQAYENDEDYSVWAALSGQLSQIELLTAGEPFVEQYRAFARGLYSRIVRKVGWEAGANEPHVRTLLRSVVLSSAGGFGDQGVLREASARFNKFVADRTSLRPDLRAAVYALAAEGGDSQTYETLRRLEREFDLQEEKVRLITALARFRQPELLRQALQASLDTTQIRSQDTPRLVVGIASNPKGAGLTWEFMKENWAEFDRRYGDGGFAIMRIIGVTGNFATREAAQDVERFFQEHPVPAGARTVQQSLERIGLNQQWLESNHQGLAQWLSSRGR
jgi:puromycin-sensitive aminopeptidase